MFAQREAYRRTLGVNSNPMSLHHTTQSRGSINMIFFEEETPKTWLDEEILNWVKENLMVS